MNAPTSIAALKGEERQKALATMAPKKKVAFLIQERKDDIAKMLPSHLSPDRLLKVATLAATTTPALLECEIPSLITAIGQCAMFGLEPNTILGHAYMIPFNKSYRDGSEWKKRKLVQVVIGYKGLIDLARRSGQIISISAHEVCEGDLFDFAFGLEEKLIHKPADGNRGRLTHFYAYAKLKDGGTAFEVMSVAQVNEIRDASALKNGAKRQSDGSVPITGPWKDHYVEMGRKTVIRRLAKYLPLSVEFQKAAALDEATEGGAAIGAIDGEFTVEPDDQGDGTGGVMSPDASVDAPESGVMSGTNKPSASAESASAQGQPGGGGAAPSNPSGAPTFDDAMASVKSGDYDQARDIARGLPENQQRQINVSIANAQSASNGGADMFQAE